MSTTYMGGKECSQSEPRKQGLVALLFPLLRLPHLLQAVKAKDFKQQVPYQSTNLSLYHSRRHRPSIMELGQLCDPFRPLGSKSLFNASPWFCQPFDVTEVALLCARNPFRGNSHQWQVSRTYVMVKIKDINILISIPCKSLIFPLLLLPHS